MRKYGNAERNLHEKEDGSPGRRYSNIKRERFIEEQKVLGRMDFEDTRMKRYNNVNRWT